MAPHGLPALHLALQRVVVRMQHRLLCAHVLCLLPQCPRLRAISFMIIFRQPQLRGQALSGAVTVTLASLVDRQPWRHRQHLQDSLAQPKTQGVSPEITWRLIAAHSSCRFRRMRLADSLLVMRLQGSAQGQLPPASLQSPGRTMFKEHERSQAAPTRA